MHIIWILHLSDLAIAGGHKHDDVMVVRLSSCPVVLYLVHSYHYTMYHWDWCCQGKLLASLVPRPPGNEG